MAWPAITRVAVPLLLLVQGAAGCLLPGHADLVVGSTTTTQDSGVLDALLDAFVSETGFSVVPIVAGTGELIEKARRGDVDVLLTHSPSREEAFVAAGDGLPSRPVMYNRFLLVGPAGDPAGAATAPNVTEALRRVHDGPHPFVSRGDRSGTHDKELDLWRRSGLDVSAFDSGWYRETGAGQAQTLLAADEFAAYALTDEATWARLRQEPLLERLGVLVEADPLLKNPYAVTLLNPQRHPDLHHEPARRFADWLVGPGGRQAIESFRVADRAVFFPEPAA